MKNLDMPAMAQSFAMTEGECGTAIDFLSEEEKYIGLTKREQACITLGIPETGDPELDELILKSERKRIAAMAMQGILQGKQTDNRSFAEIARLSVGHAKSLLKELDQ